MSIKNISRLRRAKKARANIKVQESPRLTVFRSSQHFYAQIFDNLGSKVIVSASTADRDTTWYGASFAVNENLSVSAGKSVTNFGNKTVDQESSGFAASYTMGSITVATSMNKQEGVSGVAGTEDDHKEVAVTFAF